MRKTASIVLLILVLASLPGHAASEGQSGLSLEQIAKLREVVSVHASPDGRAFAFTRQVPRDLSEEDDGPAWRELHVYRAGEPARAWIAGKVRVADPGWTPDGKHIVFVDKRGEDQTRRLYALPVDGGEATAMATLDTDIEGYSFSPDGRQLALLAMEPRDEALDRLEDKGFNQVVYEEDPRPRRLWILDLDTPEAQARVVPVEGSVQEVQWSPTGDRLAVRVTPRELVDDTLVFAKIRIIKPDGEVIGEVDTPGKLGEMAWSPDGAHLALIATSEVSDSREGRLFAVDAHGRNRRELLPELEGHVWHLDWDPAGRVVFLSYEGTDVRLGSVGVDGSEPRTLIAQGPVFTALSVAADGRIGLVGNTPQHPGELYVHDAGALSRITNSNPWLDEVALAKQEVIRYPARDGLEIEGILVWPLHYREGRRYPLILQVHGGPESHYSNGWLTRYSSPAQHAAAEGYFVFFPNYRGSTGRGEDFARLSFGRPAMEEFDDLIDGVDFLIQRGLVDSERVGITGGSYGGYATAWGATVYSDRFAAAVMNVGLSNQIAAFGTSDIPWEFRLVHLGKWPWEDWELFRQASPLYHVQKARTPILIMHGDSDPRVDPTQSRMFYRFLKLIDNGPPVRLVLYPGEGHGNQRAASRYDYSRRLMRWMNHYLKGPGGEPPPRDLDYSALLGEAEEAPTDSRKH